MGCDYRYRVETLLSPLEEGREAKYRQITNRIRKLIQEGKLQPGMRLPNLRVLAKEWKTNVFTIHSAITPLVNEGLVERRPRSGTFIQAENRKLSSVAIYFGADLWTDRSAGFFRLVYGEIQRLLKKERTESRVFIDSRITQEQLSPLPDLIKLIERREIRGVIGLMLNKNDSAWLTDLQVPFSYLGRASVHFDFEDILELVCARLAADGCRTLGVIVPTLKPHAAYYPAFEKMVRRHGMKTKPAWLKTIEEWPVGDQELFGYQKFRELWATRTKPEGFFAYPDTFCRGVIMAMLELNVRAPQDLRVILHRNSGINYLCPWKIPFVVTEVKEVAQALVDNLFAQHHKIPPPPVLIHSHLVG